MLNYKLKGFHTGKKLVDTADKAADLLRSQGYTGIRRTLTRDETLNGVIQQRGSELFLFKVIETNSRTPTPAASPGVEERLLEPAYSGTPIPEPQMYITERSALEPPIVNHEEYMEAVQAFRPEDNLTPPPLEIIEFERQVHVALFAVGVFYTHPSNRYSEININLWNGSKFTDKHNVERDYLSVPPFKTRTEHPCWLLKKYADDLVETMQIILGEKEPRKKHGEPR